MTGRTIVDIHTTSVMGYCSHGAHDTDVMTYTLYQLSLFLSSCLNSCLSSCLSSFLSSCLPYSFNKSSSLGYINARSYGHAVLCIGQLQHIMMMLGKSYRCKRSEGWGKRGGRYVILSKG